MSDIHSQLSALKRCYDDELITYKDYCKYKEKVLKNWIREDKSSEKSFWKNMYEKACRFLKYLARNLIIPILINLGLAIATHGASVGLIKWL
ncbi:21204_t:CDS:2 [Gigaspora rosea]|nr:21204_t:CDS:2 [Gigaspora rosea]